MAEANWFWAEGDKQNGPVLPAAIARLVADGKLGPDDLIWKEGMPDWIPVRKVPALMKYAKTPIATPGVLPAEAMPVQPVPVQRQAVGDEIVCPHCSAANPAGGQFCESCGMALPTGYTPPRVVDGTSFATTAAGKQLQADEFHKVTKQASNVLLWIAVFQTILPVFLIAVVSQGFNPQKLMHSQTFLPMLVIAAVFWGLYVWSRSQPLPAAIVGLVLYSTLVVVNVVMAVSRGIESTTSFTRGIGGSGISWWNIVIIAALANAISAGLKHRKMQANESIAQ